MPFITLKPEVLAAINGAIRRGEHSPAERWGGTVCERCGEWKRPTRIVTVDDAGKPIAGSDRVAHVCDCDCPPPLTTSN